MRVFRNRFGELATGKCGECGKYDDVVIVVDHAARVGVMLCVACVQSAYIAIVEAVETTQPRETEA